MGEPVEKQKLQHPLDVLIHVLHVLFPGLGTLAESDLIVHMEQSPQHIGEELMLQHGEELGGGDLAHLANPFVGLVHLAHTGLVAHHQERCARWHTRVCLAAIVLDGLNGQQVNLYEVGAQISYYMNYSQRLQLFHYLVGIANADGELCKQEKDVLEAIASAIRLNAADASSVIAMFYKDADSAYAVLEISPSATDDEVKTAYRRMAMKNHPDKVATLGPDVQKAAEEKFRKIQEAYETIKKQRGMN